MRPADALPAWLAPTLLAVLARRIEAAMAVGRSPEAVRQEAFEAARAAHPAWPMPRLAEAVSIALGLARVPEEECRGGAPYLG